MIRPPDVARSAVPHGWIVTRVSYVVLQWGVNRTLTIRLDEEQDEALAGRAHGLGKTKSELVRDLIDQAISNQPMGRRVGHVKGRVALPRAHAGWRRALKERNWR